MADETVASQIELEAPFELANLRPERTGLPFVVFVSQQGGARHGARIKISPLPRYSPADAITVTLERPPRILGSLRARDAERLTQWIDLNREVLEGYWNGTVAYTEELLDQLQPLPA